MKRSWTRVTRIIVVVALAILFLTLEPFLESIQLPPILFNNRVPIVVSGVLLVIFFTVLDIFIQEKFEAPPSQLSNSQLKKSEDLFVIVKQRIRLGQAPSVKIFYGRVKELHELKELVKYHRLIAIIGMGGVGKTTLATKLLQEISSDFEVCFWYSVKNAPPILQMLQELIRFSSANEALDLPHSIEKTITLLLELMRSMRSLIVFDNWESLLDEKHAGKYKEGCENYQFFLRTMAESPHKSCVVITSREIPEELNILSRKDADLEVFTLESLDRRASLQLLSGQGLVGTTEDWENLIATYSANPLLLKIIPETIREVYGGNIRSYLEKVSDMSYNDIIHAQFQRLSTLEKHILLWIAIEREPVGLKQLQQYLVSTKESDLFFAIQSLRRRSLIERQANKFSLQNVILDHVTKWFIQEIYNEIISLKFVLMNSHAVLSTQSNEYKLQAQRQLIIQPIIKLLEGFGLDKARKNLKIGLKKFQDNTKKPGYFAGNAINILTEAGFSLHSYDFSNMNVWQADLRSVALYNTNFSNSDFTRTVFKEKFGSILSCDFNKDGKLLAIGLSNGEVRIWRLEEWEEEFAIFRGHADWVQTVKFSPNGQILASGSDDETIKLWDVKTGSCLKTLIGHTNWIRGLSFSFVSNHLLASSSDDGTIKIWDINSGQIIKTLDAKENKLRTVAFSPQEDILASAGGSGAIHLWNLDHDFEYIKMNGHAEMVYALAFDSTGELLASSSADKTIRLWDSRKHKTLKVLSGHKELVRSINFDPNSKFILSGSDDKSVRLWKIETGELAQIYIEHEKRVRCVSFSPDGHRIASGGDDQILSLNTVDGKLLRLFRGYTNPVRAVSVSPDENIVVTGSQDGSISFWEPESRRLIHSIEAHDDRINSLTFNKSGTLLASASDDTTLKIWNVESFTLEKTLNQHSLQVWGVAISPDEQFIVSSGNEKTIYILDSKWNVVNTIVEDTFPIFEVSINSNSSLLATASNSKILKVWDIHSGKVVFTCEGHKRWIRTVTFSPRANWLASGGDDGMICIWDAEGNLIQILEGHSGRIRTLAVSKDGTLLASGSSDKTIRLWNTSSWKCTQVLKGHKSWLWSIEILSSKSLLISSSEDETTRIWNTNTGICIGELKTNLLYERMNIKGVTGVTEAQLANLKALGAITIP